MNQALTAWQRLNQYRQNWSASWLKRRIPASRELELNTANLFILPNKAGVALLMVAIAVYILGTNYANNLVLLLAYFLFAILLIALLQSFFNLYGLRLYANQPEAIFLGETVNLSIKTYSHQHRHNIHILHPDGNTQVETIDTGTDHIKVMLLPDTRGHYQIGRLRWQSSSPLGIYNAWTLLDFAQTVIVYPKPQPCPQWLDGTGLHQQNESTQNKVNEVDDFQGLKDFSPSDPLRHVAWKQLAQGRGWYTKTFAAAQDQVPWYSYHKLAWSGNEQALSQLTWLVLQCRANHSRFGLELKDKTLGPDAGTEFVNTCLLALAEHA